MCKLLILPQETNVKFISRDQWLCFWEFSRQHSLADYNKNEAWPILFDEFVEYSLFKHPPPSAMTFPTAYNNLTAVPTITFPAHAPPSFYPLLSPFSPSTTTEPTATTNVPNNSGSPYRPAPSLNFSPLIEFTPLFS
ncbi:hypothetical protein Pelo_13887 [Pelomyxa schiedti]|nr:hypothetical protein Pelo_13887 [Pelomyxa schiedti]